MKRSEGALIRLVAIGKLRNGRVLYMPEPELRVIGREAISPIIRFAFGDEAAIEFASGYMDQLLDLFVADQQRVYDAILTGECAPFEARQLPTFAQILRWS